MLCRFVLPFSLLCFGTLLGIDFWVVGSLLFGLSAWFLWSCWLCSSSCRSLGLCWLLCLFAMPGLFRYSDIFLPMDCRYTHVKDDTACCTTELRGRSPTRNPNFNANNPKTLAQRVYQMSHIDHEAIAGTYHCCRNTGPLLGIDYPGMTNRFSLNVRQAPKPSKSSKISIVSIEYINQWHVEWHLRGGRS